MHRITATDSDSLGPVKPPAPQMTLYIFYSCCRWQQREGVGKGPSRCEAWEGGITYPSTFYKFTSNTIYVSGSQTQQHKLHRITATDSDSLGPVKPPAPQMTLCIVQSAAGILACNSGEYAGGKIKIRNC